MGKFSKDIYSNPTGAPTGFCVFEGSTGGEASVIREGGKQIVMRFEMFSNTYNKGERGKNCLKE